MFDRPDSNNRRGRIFRIVNYSIRALECREAGGRGRRRRLNAKNSEKHFQREFSIFHRGGPDWRILLSDALAPKLTENFEKSLLTFWHTSNYCLRLNLFYHPLHKYT